MSHDIRWSVAKRARSSRPDLSKSHLVLLALATLFWCVIVIYLGRGSRPGDPLNQLSAIFGTVLLLGPLAFFLAKRCGFSANPPFWFVLHAVCGFGGLSLIAIHVASVSSITPALVPLAALVFLVVQGVWVRGFLTGRLAFLFARSPKSFGFGAALTVDRVKLAKVIDQKITLLRSLDPKATEATFSPRLRHWALHPIKSLRYDLLARKEAGMVGARRRAGLILSYSRTLHIAVAAIFFASLVTHIVVMLFFAGYAAKGNDIYWWHIASLGGA